MKRDAMLIVRIPEALKVAVQRAGVEDHGRTLSGMVVRILGEWASEHGYYSLPKAPKRPVRARKGG